MYKKIEKKFKQIADIIDKKFKNWTVMVVIISSLIVGSWFLNATVNADLTANILQTQNKKENIQYLIINWKKYKVILEEVK